MPKRLFGYLLLGLCLAAGSAVAETVYVHDTIRLGVRTNPNPSESPVAVVTTGDALQVLDRTEGYIKIRSEDGTEGWVSESYISKEKPAMLKLAQLQLEYDKRVAELSELRNELTATTEKQQATDKHLAEVEGENAALQQELSRYKSSADELRRKYMWAFQTVAVILLFLLGFYIGVRWYKGRITSRFGGMEI